MLRRLRKYIDYKGISVRSFEIKIGASDGLIRRAINNNTDIQSKWIKSIADNYHDINIDWLITGRGEMLINTSTPTLRPLEKDTQDSIGQAIKSDRGIPLIPVDAMAGFLSGDSHAIMEYECEYYQIPSFRGAEFMIPVKGSSMQPKYNSGDIVACKRLPLDTFFLWHKVYVVDTEQGVLIKRIDKADNDEYVKLVSENPDYQPVELHRSHIFSIAAVIGLIRLE